LTRETLDILKLKCSTFLGALCQAINLSHLEENLKKTINNIVSQVAKKIITVEINHESHHFGLYEDLFKIMDNEYVFVYFDDPCRSNYSLM